MPPSSSPKFLFADFPVYYCSVDHLSVPPRVCIICSLLLCFARCFLFIRFRFHNLPSPSMRQCIVCHWLSTDRDIRRCIMIILHLVMGNLNGDSHDSVVLRWRHPAIVKAATPPEVFQYSGNLGCWSRMLYIIATLPFDAHTSGVLNIGNMPMKLVEKSAVSE